MNIGMQLRQAREARGLSVGAVAATTRIQPRVIDGIERNDLSAIPPRPFARGFVATYAREVGLDPAETVRAYFAQFTSPIAGSPPPSRTPLPPAGGSTRGGRRAVLAVVACAAVVLAVAAVMSRTASGPAAEAGAVGTSGTGTPAASPAPAALAGGRPEVAPAAAPAHTGVVVVLETDRAAWITASADGARVLYRTVPAGARETLRGDRMVSIRAGDAGAVRVSVDGRAAAPLGRRGEVRTVVFTAGGR